MPHGEGGYGKRETTRALKVNTWMDRSRTGSGMCCCVNGYPLAVWLRFGT